MLQKTVLPLSLKEPQYKILNMLEATNDFGTRQVSLVHVQSSSKSGSKRRKKLLHIAQKIRDLGFECEIYFKSGYVASEVASISLELEADFISLLWRPKTALRQALLGNVITDTVRQSDVPVFIYKSPYYKSPRINLRNVLYATDFKRTDSRVMNYLMSEEFRANTLYLLHVGSRAPDPEAEEKRRAQVMQNLSRLEAECSHAYNKIEKLQSVGSAKNQIAHQAWKHNVDLIILGKFDQEVPFANLLGSVAEGVPHKAHCSVFIIPGIRKQN
ncbi:MAG: universal stress protein [Desulfohalobiaceae bacterium]